jgi:hypothetical protein
MKELTLFTMPKAFLGEFAVIQRNAIHSWVRLGPSSEVVLLGDEQGTKELAEELGVRHVPEVLRNEFGTPLVSSVISQAEKHSETASLCYVNADIVLFPDFPISVGEVRRRLPKALLVGHRTNVAIPDLLDFSENWEVELRHKANREGILEACDGLDYFVFPRGFWGEIPPFAVGRTMWDQWLIYRARSRRMPVVDCSPRMQVIHQKHGYAHHPGGKEGVWNGIEAQRNLELAGGYRRAYTLKDATHLFEKRGVRKRLLPFDLKRSLILSFSTQPRIRQFIGKAKTVFPAVRS